MLAGPRYPARHVKGVQMDRSVGERERAVPQPLFATLAVASALLVASCAGAAPSSTPQPSVSSVSPGALTSTSPSAPAPSGATARDAVLHGPRGLAFDANGDLYVAECEWTWASIEKIDPSGLVTRFAGTGEPGFTGDGGAAVSADLHCAAGIALGPDGAVYFADHLNNRIRRVDSAGVITTIAGSGPAGLDLGSFSGDGGPATQATLQEPWGLAFDGAGRLYVADRDNVRVRTIDTDGNIATLVGGVSGSAGDGGPAANAQICPPVGIAINAAGSLILPDACTTGIRIVDAKGVIKTIAQTHSRDTPPDPGSEGNVVFDSTGAMFVQAGPRIFRVDSGRVVTAVAGNGSIGTPSDGSLAVNVPLPVEIWGLAFDRAGNLYVADGANSIWRIDRSGVITRFAGKL
jgi:hypothetical protein